MDRLIAPAKEFMKAYFLDGKEKTPSDFDEDIIGGLDFDVLFKRPKWNNTPFFYALTELVEDGTVKFKQLEDGTCVYWVPKQP
jgi:hypothetical protein